MKHDMTEIPSAILNRKGARTTAAVSAEVRELLNAGRIESISLCEWLVVDHGRLAENVLPEMGLEAAIEPSRETLQQSEKLTALKQTLTVGSSYWDNFLVLRGLKYAAAMAVILGETADAVRSGPCATLSARICTPRLRKA